MADAKVSESDFLVRLTEKLSHFDANLILNAAMVSAGVPKKEGSLKKGEARDICLALIKKGGPAYKVGAGMYREVIG